MFPRGNGKRRKSSPRDSKHHSPLYRPSIYSYVCRGSYNVTSAVQNAGTCTGLRSRLELLSDMEVSTRDQAVQDFTTWASGGDPMDHPGALELDEHHTQGEVGVRPITVPPVLVHKHSPEAIPSSKVSDSDSQSRELAGDIFLDQEWSCLGSTQVDYLTLTNVTTGEDQVVAVAPRNNGLLLRSIRTTPENSLTCVRLGWLSIMLDSVVVEEHEGDVKENGDNRTGNVIEEIPSAPSADAFTTAKETVIKATDFSRSVGDNIAMNTEWLYNNLCDDFPARMWVAGNRLMNEVPGTMTKTASFARKIVNRMFFGNSGEDNR